MQKDEHCVSDSPQRRGYSLFRRLLAHIQLAAGFVVLVCFVFDKFNSSMEFMVSDITKAIIGGLAALAMATAILMLIDHWPRSKA